MNESILFQKNLYFSLFVSFIKLKTLQSHSPQTAILINNPHPSTTPYPSSSGFVWLLFGFDNDVREAGNV